MTDYASRYEAERAARDAERERKEAALTKTIETLIRAFVQLLVAMSVVAVVLGWMVDRAEGVMVSGTIIIGAWLAIVAFGLFIVWIQRDTL